MPSARAGSATSIAPASRRAAPTSPASSTALYVPRDRFVRSCTRRPLPSPENLVVTRFRPWAWISLPALSGRASDDTDEREFEAEDPDTPQAHDRDRQARRRALAGPHQPLALPRYDRAVAAVERVSRA